MGFIASQTFGNLIECVVCGRQFTAQRRDALTCSDVCRKRKSHGDHISKIWQRPFTCETCGKNFYPPQPNQRPKYCSNACKQKAYRERKNAEL